MGILVLNAGSSSLKVAFFLPPSEDAAFSKSFDLASEKLDHKSASVLALEELGAVKISAVAHRIVHGGPDFSEPVRITGSVRKKIESLNELAPLHNPPALEVVDFMSDQLPNVDQFAVFDTAYFAQLPPASAVYPLPYDWFENHGIRRYGFHGINHQYCAEQCEALGFLPKTRSRLIVCHLGNGCSVSAIQNGKPIATTMGFTPLDGVVMGSRPGAIDPGILLHLLKTQRFTIEDLEEALNHQSGLHGISGVSSDLREIAKAIESGNERAKLAFEIFTNSVRSAIASYTAQMGGLDGLVFTGGIGEHSADCREQICAGLEIIGCELDAVANHNYENESDYRISKESCSVEIQVIKAREELSIARQIQRFL